MSPEASAPPAGDDVATPARPADDDAAARPSPPTGARLVFVQTANDVRAEPGDVTVVLDAAHVVPPGATTIAARDLGAALAAGRNLVRETTDLLDDWATRGRFAERLVEDGVSFWYGRRLPMWWWLQERLLWVGLLRDLLDRHPDGTAIHLEGVDERALSEVAQVVAAERRLVVTGLPDRPQPPPRHRRSPMERAVKRLRGLLPDPEVRRQRVRDVRMRVVSERVRRLDRGGSGLLVLADSGDRQRVGDRSAGMLADPFLAAVVEELRAGPLDPVILEQDLRVEDEAGWRRFAARDKEAVLPMDAVDAGVLPEEADAARQRATDLARTIRESPPPLLVDGLDLGPLAAAALAARVRSHEVFYRQRIGARRLLEQLRPAALLLVNEYGRPGWLAAAADTGVPVAAIQHGIIHPWHMGYVHTSRTPSLPLPARTYVFGAWERRLLVESSVYRADEVVVAGSPRLDVAWAAGDPTEPAEADRARVRAGVRAELGVADADRLVVVSTTRTPLVRRFGLAPVVAAVLDRALPNVHLVFKLHPREVEDDLYPRLVQALGKGRGLPVPPVSVVKDIDLYRLLQASDGHLGLYSTVLTEAVLAGTRNFVAAIAQSADLLGYVEAGVARPVRNGGDLLDGLEAAPSSEEQRRAFIEDHFRLGPASQRIADDLTAWLIRDGTPNSQGRRRRPAKPRE